MDQWIRMENDTQTLPPRLALTNEQNAAVEMAVKAARRPGTIAVLSGFAGTGKTTTLREVLRELPGSELLTPTGRAALRATQVTGKAASTIHRWLYTPVTVGKEEDDQVVFRPGYPAAPESGLVIVDEASMVNREVWSDLWKAVVQNQASILLVGDGFQLPPVAPEDPEPFSVFGAKFETHARVNLTQPQRTALEHPVYRAATRMRMSDWAQCQDILRSELPQVKRGVPETVAAIVRRGDDHVVVAHRNATRLGLNTAIRGLLGRDGWPKTGEPMLVRRNNYALGVCNGEIISMRESSTRTIEVASGPVKMLQTWVATANEDPRPCVIYPPSVFGDARFPDGLMEACRINQAQLLRAQLGYAVTCHASQGSEWDKVLMIVEGSLSVMPDEERVRWAYTCATRAKVATAVAWL